MIVTRALAALAWLVAVGPAAGDWVELVDQTSVRMPVPPNAWGDVDRDGDVDLIVARKEPFTTTGRRANVLLINEGTDEGHPVDGVLIDRTIEFASSSDVVGDEGFLTPTNDRDIALVDVDGDGWLDIVTAPAQTDGAPRGSATKMPASPSCTRRRGPGSPPSRRAMSPETGSPISTSPTTTAAAVRSSTSTTASS